VGAEHPHPDGGDRAAPTWGAPAPPAWRRLLDQLRRLVGGPSPAADRPSADSLPLALRRSELAAGYLAADRRRDHPAAAEAARSASERAVETAEWWQADQWAHRALWHYEQAEMTLEAVRQARRIGDLRVAAGDPDSARRYYAEAIDESRDIGAEREQGLAAVGLGRAQLDLGDVTGARRLASAAIDLLERSEASPPELASARELLGTEVAVGEGSKEEA
jgi:tetratricopeptide (TPR) repeat protein